MPDDPDGVRRHYETDANLAARQRAFAQAAGPASASPTDFFDWPADALVLDVGCGNGLWTAPAVERTTAGLVVGIDTSPGMIAAARQRAPGVAYMTGDARHLPVGNGRAGVVLALWMLYHVADIDCALREVLRVREPGGRLIAATNANHGPLEPLFNEAASDVAGHTVAAWVPPLDFAAENGAEILGSHFERVDTHPSVVPFETDDLGPLLAATATMRDLVRSHLGDGFDFDAFLERLTELFRRQFGDGPVRFERRSAIFVAHAPDTDRRS